MWACWGNRGRKTLLGLDTPYVLNMKPRIVRAIGSAPPFLLSPLPPTVPSLPQIPLDPPPHPPHPTLPKDEAEAIRRKYLGQARARLEAAKHEVMKTLPDCGGLAVQIGGTCLVTEPEGSAAGSSRGGSSKAGVLEPSSGVGFGAPADPLTASSTARPCTTAAAVLDGQWLHTAVKQLVLEGE